MPFFNLTDLPAPYFSDAKPSTPIALIEPALPTLLYSEKAGALQNMKIALSAQCGDHREALFAVMAAEGYAQEVGKLKGKRQHELWLEGELVGLIAMTDMDVAVGHDHRYLLTELQSAFILPKYRRRGVMTAASFHIGEVLRSAIQSVIQTCAGSRFTLISSHTAIHRDEAWRHHCERFYFEGLGISNHPELAKGAEGVMLHVFANLSVSDSR